MSVRVTILGSGSSGGVPRADGAWGACDPNEPKNRRSRCGLLVQHWDGPVGAPEASTTVLIDTAPELRDQLIAAKVTHIDAVLYTHDHADQTHGIDDLRAFVLKARKRVRVFMDGPTRATLTTRFDYCFAPKKAYPAILEDAGDLKDQEEVVIEGAGGPIAFLPLAQDHGLGTASLGFRFGEAAYSNDVVAIPESSMARLGGLDLWIVDALRYTAHPTHANLEQALAWAARLKPKRTVLTNMHIDLDYQTLLRELPAGVEPGFDGWAADL